MRPLGFGQSLGQEQPLGHDTIRKCGAHQKLIDKDLERLGSLRWRFDFALMGQHVSLSRRFSFDSSPETFINWFEEIPFSKSFYWT